METQAIQKGKAVETETNTLEKESEKLEEVTRMENGDRINDTEISSITMANPGKGSHEGGRRHFLKKLRKIVEDSETDSIISWSITKESIMIWNNDEFIANILPRFFKHKNFSSFIRQLNYYGFKKMNRDRDRSEYAHEDFQGGQEHLVNSIMKKCKQGGFSNDSNPNLDVDPSYLQAKIETLKSYTNTMKVEIMELKQQNECLRSYLASMKKRIEKNNEHKKQVHIFLEKAFCNRVFFNQFTQLIRKKRGLESGQIAKKQRLEDPESVNNLVSLNQLENAEKRNEEEVITEKAKEREPVSGSVVHEGTPSKEKKAEEAVECVNLDFFPMGSMFWDSMLLEDLKCENEARAKAELANYWPEEVIFDERKP